MFYGVSLGRPASGGTAGQNELGAGNRQADLTALYFAAVDGTDGEV